MTMTLINKMKITAIASLLSSLLIIQSVSASSSVKYECDALLPKAKLEVLLIHDRKIGYAMDITFKNLAIKKPFTGFFNLNVYNKDSDFMARGILGNGPEAEDRVDVTIQGSLDENVFGEINFNISAGWDHRIEYGYSNYITCRKL